MPLLNPGKECRRHFKSFKGISTQESLQGMKARRVFWHIGATKLHLLHQQHTAMVQRQLVTKRAVTIQEGRTILGFGCTGHD